MASDPNAGVCLIRRVVIRNYKSIAACDVVLGPLTFLVGPNGSGKSNFLDAIRFLSDALRYSLEHAIRDRGGIRSVLRNAKRGQSGLAGPTTGIRVDVQLSNGMRAHYAFEIRGTMDRFSVDREEAVVTGGPPGTESFFQTSRGEVVDSTFAAAPAVVKDRLLLVTLSGMPEFRPLYDALSTIGCYNFNPDTIRDLRQPDAADHLARDGANLANVLAELGINNPPLKSRIEEYLSQVVPGTNGVDAISLGPLQTLAFRQYAGQQSKRGLRFLATSMSDGTLRALAILVALFQSRGADEAAPLLVGLEEPETALHPAAAAVLIDAMRDATSMRQVIVTSHSPDLLDNPSIADSEILPVMAEAGTTSIGHLDEAGRSVLRDHLFTAGDLLRMNQLRPDPAAGTLQPSDVVLFGTGAPA
jgi:predicted ATPase